MLHYNMYHIFLRVCLAERKRIQPKCDLQWFSLQVWSVVVVHQHAALYTIRRGFLVAVQC